MARKGKEPKPYTLKSRRGERPYSYSEQYGAWRLAIMSGRDDANARRADFEWKRRFSPDPLMRDPQFRPRLLAA